MQQDQLDALLGEVAFLVTGFHVSGDFTRRKLQRKYDMRLA